MVDRRDEAAIRARAYQLWEESGRADGSQDQHWRQAEREAAEKAQGAAPHPDAGSGVPPIKAPQDGAGHRGDGMSRHPSVLDPAPGRSGS